MSDKVTTYEALVNECKRLRGLHERAEAEYFVFLVCAESDHEEVWSATGCTDFEQFIRSNNLCLADRYREFKRGLAEVGEQSALTRGVPWTIEAGRMTARVPTDVVRGAFAERADAFIAVQGVAPSEQTVRQWRAELEPRSKPPAVVSHATELQRLREEVKRLRSENKALVKRVAELEGKAA